MDRRSFLRRLAAMAGASVLATACAEEDAAGPSAAGDFLGKVDGDHPHSVRLAREQIALRESVRLPVTGAHTHFVTLSEQQVIDIGVLKRVTQPTEPDANGHGHNVTFN